MISPDSPIVSPAGVSGCILARLYRLSADLSVRFYSSPLRKRENGRGTFPRGSWSRDRIHNRLEGIEQLLRRAFDEQPIANNAPRPPESLPTDSFNASQDFADSSRNGPSYTDSETALEGSSSLKAATVYASDFFQTVLGQSPAADTSTRVNAALSSLKQMIEINSYRLFISKDRLIDCCREIYFAVDNFSLPTFVIANATLRYLFQEKVQASQDPLFREEYRKLSQLCRDNLETAMNKFSVLAPPSLENVEAYLLGAIYAIEVSQPMLAWQLVSSAAGTCQTLGWHQLVPHSDSTTDRKISLFWLTYLLDKGLSLRLGRPAVIHDAEITLPECLDKADVPSGWRDLLTQWIRHSRLVGRAYQDLYSPSALRTSTQERGERARSLIAALKQIMDDSLMPLGQAHLMERNTVDFGSAPDRMIKTVLKADEVWYWTTLTFIRRAVPSTEVGHGAVSPACLESARMAFEAHGECMRMTDPSSETKALYLLWTIIYTPFVPLIVVFCNVIETSNPADIRILGEFCESLKPLCGIFEAIQELHDLCQVLYNLAISYVEAKMQSQGGLDKMAEDGFDVQSKGTQGAVSFSSSYYDVFSTGSSIPVPQLNNHVSQVRDWISGNMQWMDMSQEDFSEFLAQLS
ncbi:C6 transcription factor [Fusarium sp. NRRL 25303]|nr:C6 transcription factor [Fusarium sp. NRRL 25303]